MPRSLSLSRQHVTCWLRRKTAWPVAILPGDMGRLELGEGVYGMGLDTVLARRPCADISLKYLRKQDGIFKN